MLYKKKNNQNKKKLNKKLILTRMSVLPFYPILSKNKIYMKLYENSNIIFESFENLFEISIQFIYHKKEFSRKLFKILKILMDLT